MEDKQRLIVSKISTKMIEQMVLTRHKPGPETNSSTTLESRQREALPADRFVYRTITPTGEKITAHIKIEDPRFLINPMDLTRQDPEEDL